MTTAEPLIDEPTIPVADLDPMLADRERLCELSDLVTGQSCQNRAAWAVTLAGRCRCDYVADVQTDLWCDLHLTAARSRDVPACDRCWTYIRITRIEPIR